ncbi:hypothetical protein [uncultured Hymenobacter sp.]|uniref:hypothetical protein n=1 Tax=uncultured Hymenobacter sp. TaxID=170016 RepID=UPI0035C9F8F6
MWDFKFRGATLEIITPFSTTSNKFVSVFLTERSSDFIVTDGGYLHLAEYVENENVQQSRCYNQALSHYEAHYKVQRVLDRYDKLIFYIKTSNRALVTSLIHDMASFITGIVNAQQMTLEVDQEAVTRERFAKNAGSFLLEVFPGREIKWGQKLRRGDNITFSAGIYRGSNISLVQFITGSNTYHFASSMAKATVNFLAVRGSALEPSVRHKLSLIDTNANGYRDGGNTSVINLLRGASEIVPWEERSSIVELVEEG